MGVRILLDEREGAVLYDSVSGWAFGPIFPGGEDDAQEFLDWLKVDARGLSEYDLKTAHHDWLDRKADQDRKVSSRV